MRISDWSSDVCSSDLLGIGARAEKLFAELRLVEADFVRQLFICGEVADELGDKRQVGLRGGADRDRHTRHLCRARATFKCALAPLITRERLKQVHDGRSTTALCPR